MTYARAAQPRDGAILPLRMMTRCFATVTQSHSALTRYLCGGEEDCGGGEDGTRQVVSRTGTAARLFLSAGQRPTARSALDACGGYNQR
jgi:hypothetical protein